MRTAHLERNPLDKFPSRSIRLERPVSEPDNPHSLVADDDVYEFARLAVNNVRADTCAVEHFKRSVPPDYLTHHTPDFRVPLGQDRGFIYPLWLGDDPRVIVAQNQAVPHMDREPVPPLLRGAGIGV